MGKVIELESKKGSIYASREREAGGPVRVFGSCIGGVAQTRGLQVA